MEPVRRSWTGSMMALSPPVGRAGVPSTPVQSFHYGLGTMTNDLEAADNLLYKEDYKMLNVLGVVRSVSTGLRRLHTSFGGFGLYNLPVEQMIC